MELLVLKYKKQIFSQILAYIQFKFHLHDTLIILICIANVFHYFILSLSIQ